MKKIANRICGVMTLIFLLNYAGMVYATDDSDEIYFASSSLGDMNDDNIISPDDETYMEGYFFNENSISDENSDISCDGVVNIVDYVYLKDILSEDSDRYRAADIKSDNAEEMVDLEFKFIYDKKEQTVTIDVLEQQVFKLLNDFRKKFGLYTTGYYYLPSYACDMMAESYSKNNKLWDKAFLYCPNHRSFCIKTTSTDPETITNLAVSTANRKGAILHGTYNLSVGHYGNSWVIMTSY